MGSFSLQLLLRKENLRMRYVVTGGAGFIGSNIVDELLRRGQQVVVLDNLSGGKEANLAGVREEIDLRVGTITDLAALQSACKGADYVIHLAALASVPRSVKDPIESNRVNIDGTLNVLVAARDAKVRRVVFAASSSAYGESASLPKIETMRPAPISPYGVTKYVGELYAQVFGRVYGLENASVRYFNVFGPRQDPTSQYSGVLSRFMLALIEGKSPVIYGDGEQSRDFTYVENIVDETLRACEAEAASGQVFNGGTGARITLNEVIKLLEGITGKKIQAKYEPVRTGDILHSQADVSLARKVLGYEPRVHFEEGLRRTWDWYKSAYGKK
jgi:nucleoside-diphosphate-sugar epimerase